MINSIPLKTFEPAFLSLVVGLNKIFGAYALFSFLIHVLNSTIRVTGITLLFLIEMLHTLHNNSSAIYEVS